MDVFCSLCATRSLPQIERPVRAWVAFRRATCPSSLPYFCPTQTAHRSIFVIALACFQHLLRRHSEATMPPLPSTVQTLTARLTTLSDSNKAVGQLIQRLAKLDFQPGSQPLNSTDEGDVRLELSAEIHESLKAIEEELELLRQEAEDITLQSASLGRRRDSFRDSERSRLAVLLARLTEDLRL